MIELPRRTLILAAIAVLILIGINLWLTPDVALRFSPTSFGVGPSGYKAAFDLAAELGLPVTRSYLAPKRLPHARQLLMISPSLLDQSANRGDADARDLLDWVRSGGTAVVSGGTDSDWSRLGISTPTGAGTDHAAITGDFAPIARQLAVPGLLHFVAAPHDAQVRLRTPDAPFALERRLGTGRLVAIADDRFLRNVNLGRADNCLLFIDLMRRFGPLVFDEHCHGMLGDLSLDAALIHSRAMLPLGVGLILAIVWILAQHPWPRRLAPDAPDLPAPTLEPFVESLGVLYARAADPPAAFRAYRDGFLRRRRRRLSPFGVFDEDLMLHRIARDPALSDETRRWLLGPSIPANQADLLRAVRAIEAYAGNADG